MKQATEAEAEARAHRAKKEDKTWPSGPERVLFLLCALLAPTYVFAAVEITHVEYDPAGNDKGREWIEITNKGGESVDIAKWKLQEAGVKHTIAPQGSSILPAGAAAVIASDPATYSSEHAGSQLIFKSSFSLSNTGETLALLDAKGAVENSLTYTAAPIRRLADAPAPKAKASSAKKPASKTASSTKTSTASVLAAGESLGANGLQTKNTAGILPWLAGLGGIALVGVAGVFLVPRSPAPGAETKSAASEFDIEG